MKVLEAFSLVLSVSLEIAKVNFVGMLRSLCNNLILRLLLKAADRLIQSGNHYYMECNQMVDVSVNWMDFVSRAHKTVIVKTAFLHLWQFSPATVVTQYKCNLEKNIISVTVLFLLIQIITALY